MKVKMKYFGIYKDTRFQLYVTVLCDNPRELRQISSNKPWVVFLALTDIVINIDYSEMGKLELGFYPC
jgi:hypothetical protein